MARVGGWRFSVCFFFQILWKPTKVVVKSGEERNGKKMSLGVGEYFLWILACCGDIFPSFVPGSARHFPLFRWHGVKTERKTEKGKKERFGKSIYGSWERFYRFLSNVPFFSCI